MKPAVEEAVHPQGGMPFKRRKAWRTRPPEKRVSPPEGGETISAIMGKETSVMKESDAFANKRGRTHVGHALCLSSRKEATDD